MGPALSPQLVSCKGSYSGDGQKPVQGWPHVRVEHGPKVVGNKQRLWEKGQEPRKSLPERQGYEEWQTLHAA